MYLIIRLNPSASTASFASRLNSSAFMVVVIAGIVNMCACSAQCSAKHKNDRRKLDIRRPRRVRRVRCASSSCNPLNNSCGIDANEQRKTDLGMSEENANTEPNETRY